MKTGEAAVFPAELSASLPDWKQRQLEQLGAEDENENEAAPTTLLSLPAVVWPLVLSATNDAFFEYGALTATCRALRDDLNDGATRAELVRSVAATTRISEQSGMMERAAQILARRRIRWIARNAIMQHDASMISLCLALGWDPNVRWEDGASAIELCMVHDCDVGVELLLGRPAQDVSLPPIIAEPLTTHSGLQSLLHGTLVGHSQHVGSDVFELRRRGIHLAMLNPVLLGVLHHAPRALRALVRVLRRPDARVLVHDMRHATMKRDVQPLHANYTANLAPPADLYAPDRHMTGADGYLREALTHATMCVVAIEGGPRPGEGGHCGMMMGCMLRAVGTSFFIARGLATQKQWGLLEMELRRADSNPALCSLLLEVSGSIIARHAPLMDETTRGACIRVIAAKRVAYRLLRAGGAEALHAAEPSRSAIPAINNAANHRNDVKRSLEVGTSEKYTLADLEAAEAALKHAEDAMSADGRALSSAGWLGVNPASEGAFEAVARLVEGAVAAATCAPVVVIECGATGCRVGMAGDAAPRLVFAPVTGQPRPPTTGGEVLVGDVALESRRTHAIRYPIEYGVPTNWDGVERLWRHAYTAGVGRPPETQPVMIVESPNNPRYSREKLTQMMFEELKVPALCLVHTPVLVLAAHGLRTGLVIDSGEDLTHILCVYEGHVLYHTLPRPHFYRGIGGGRAGQFVTDGLMKLLSTNLGVTFSTTKEREVANQLKEKHAFVAPSSESSSEHSPVVCPLREAIDGHETITLGAERHQCTERLFTPDEDELDISQGDGLVAGLHEAAWQALQRCPDDLRQTMCEHVVLSGGNAMLPGFAERMRRELGTLASAQGLEIRLVADETQPNRRIDAWVGASRMAATAGFEGRCITRDEYEECGPSVVHRRCF